MKQLRIGGSLTQQAYDALREAIINGELDPNVLYSIGYLAGLLNVSKTPVREALIKLGTETMIRFERNRGVRILRTTPHDISEVFQLRLLLEVPAARAAASIMNPAEVERLEAAHSDMCAISANGRGRDYMVRDRDFHAIILASTGNLRLAATVAGLRSMVLVRGLCTAPASRSFADISDEHAAVLTHIKAGNADAAGQAMGDHLLRTAQLLIRQEFGAAFSPADGASMEPSAGLVRWPLAEDRSILL